jgi:hypothetical protein
MLWDPPLGGELRRAERAIWLGRILLSWIADDAEDEEHKHMK